MPNNPKTPITIELLKPHHDLSGFSCGEETLDDWLQRKALKNQKLDATRTFVAHVEESKAIIGYYGLSMSEIVRTDAPKAAQRNMPSSIPVVLLGRLAIHQEWQGQGLGRFLMRHVIHTAYTASQSVAARMIMTQPLDQRAYEFYQSTGFEPLKSKPDILVIDLKKVEILLN